MWRTHQTRAGSRELGSYGTGFGQSGPERLLGARTCASQPAPSRADISSKTFHCVGSSRPRGRSALRGYCKQATTSRDPLPASVRLSCPPCSLRSAKPCCSSHAKAASVRARSALGSSAGRASWPSGAPASPGAAASAGTGGGGSRRGSPWARCSTACCKAMGCTEGGRKRKAAAASVNCKGARRVHTLRLRSSSGAKAAKFNTLTAEPLPRWPSNKTDTVPVSASAAEAVT